jgi:hypothetical protein
MIKDYEEIRKVLIDLLCVGDKIYWIHSDIALKSHYVSNHCVKEIGKTILSFGEWTNYSIYKEELEAYKGQLFLWEKSEDTYPFRSIKRINKMLRILKSLEYGERLRDNAKDLTCLTLCR